MTSKIFISANELLDDAFELGNQVLDSGFRPDLVIGLWRGGSTVAIAIHELLSWSGIVVDHIPVRTQLYTGLDQRNSNVEIVGLEYIATRTDQFNRLLLVDDVFDTGTTMLSLAETLYGLYKQSEPPELRIATPWYKPQRNKTDQSPHYYLRTTDAWLVFPHELCGIDRGELLSHKPGIDKIRTVVLESPGPQRQHGIKLNRQENSID